MKIQVTRVDPLGNIPNSEKPLELSKDLFDSWENVFIYLRDCGVAMSTGHELEFRANTETQFYWNQMVINGSSAYACKVQFDVRVL
jgi:hypothetical protein